ncbi:hypothetical protein EVC29_010 [Rhizobium phage RHph_Y52]|nr:hypothetical protein EVC16_010 [Rhizobium phage RHph_Y21]QIG76711.1 hypothetical protein EVC29_010 [Rhizobium phage RHph_Y52]
MAQEMIHLLTPLGRLVRGSVTERAKEDYDGNPYEDGKGPFELGFAVRKDDPHIAALLGKIYNHGKAGYATKPAIVQRMDIEWQSGFNAGSFRYKIRDGDKPNKEGRVNENTVGHWVFNLQSYLPFKTTYVTNYGLPKFKNAQGVDIEPNTEIPPSLIKIGDYAHMNIGTKVNDKDDHTAGMFMNINAVILAAHGPAITGGIDLKTATSGLESMIGTLPPGASVAPVAGAAPAGLPAPAASAPVAGVPGLPAPSTVASPAPGLPTASPSNVQPHETFLAGPGAGVPGGAPAGAGVGLPLPG